MKSLIIIIVFILVTFLQCYFHGSSLLSEVGSKAATSIAVSTSLKSSNASMTPFLIKCDCNPKYEEKCKQIAPDLERLGRNVTISEFWRPVCFHLTKNAVFFHAGKGGGGTIHSILTENRIAFTHNHPTPLPTIVRRLENHEFDILIQNVRDPADRYISAFRWRLKTLLKRCDPSSGEKCIIKANPILRSEREELEILKKYNSDPNLLAESLCEDSPHLKDAIKDLKKIGHSTPLAKWLKPFLDSSSIEGKDPYGIQKFLVVPMKRRGNNDTEKFEQQVNELSVELLSNKYGLEVARSIMDQKPKSSVVSSRLQERQRHSSAKQYNNNTAPLSPLGECCMVRYLKDDYRLIRSMLAGADDFDDNVIDAVLGNSISPLESAHPIIGSACSWGSQEQRKSCRSDLLSMLGERSHYFDNPTEKCSDVYQSRQSHS